MSELRSFRNLRYATKPRLVEHLLEKLKVEIKDGTKYVIFHDPIYVNSPFKFSIGFSTQFTDREVLCSQEVENWLTAITGYRLVTKWGIPINGS